MAQAIESGYRFLASGRWSWLPNEGVGRQKERGEAKNKSGMSSVARANYGAAVVKVPPLMGCVKYKAQDVVLAVRIPLFMRH